jgi:membrane-bound lytic murein transglycosylase D
MLAALSIVKDPELYGFTDLEMDYPLTFDVIDLPGGIDLRTLAEIIEADYEEIKALKYPVRIPFGSKEKATEKMQEIERRARVKFVLHRITSKDNISRIARKYASDVMRIKEVNGLRSNSIRSRKRIIVPIVGESRNAYAASLKPVDDRTMSLERSARYYYVYKEGNKKIYLVKKGDSLYKISRRFGVSVSTLKRLNGLRGNMIRPGQKIAIRVYGKPAKGAQKTNRSSYTYRVSGGKKIYTVRQGNSLYSIARAFGISIKNLKKMNGLQGEIIRPGMKLIVGYTG